MEQSINDIRFVSSEKYEELKNTGNPSTQYIIDPKDLTLKSDLESFKSSVIKKDKKPDFLWTPVFRFKTSSDVTVNTDIEIQVSPFSTQIKSTHPDGNDIIELAPGIINPSQVNVQYWFVSQVNTVDGQKRFLLRCYLELRPSNNLVFSVLQNNRQFIIPLYLYAGDFNDFIRSNKTDKASYNFNEYFASRNLKITEEEALNIPASWNINLSGNLFSSPIFFTKEMTSEKQTQNSMIEAFKQEIEAWKQKHIDLLTSANNKFKLNFYPSINLSNVNVWDASLKNSENVTIDYKRIDKF